MLTEIKINELYPHPQNPRKDIGDISELAESIKSQGIFQNLTVIKGGAGVPEGEDGYTVIIGHRRLAASKLAGLETLPCSVAEMDEKEQIATMLLENMQRSDLTYYEQAQGFQMMLDLGETQTSIAEKTGFSPATVSRRLRLTKLDQDKLREVSTGRQISLNDLEMLNKIESLDKRNELLDIIGTSQFDWNVKQAIEREKTKKQENTWRETLIAAGVVEIENRWDSKYVTCDRSWLSVTDNPKEYVRAADEQYFEIAYGSVYFRKDRSDVIADHAADKARKKQELINQKREELKAASKRACEMRRKFAEGISNAVAKKHFVDIVTFAFYAGAMWGTAYVEDDEVLKLLDLEWQFDEDENSYIEITNVKEVVEKQPERMFWLMVYENTGDSENQTYYDYLELKHKENAELNALYDFLIKLGYEMSDEEKQLRDGTHSLFVKDE